MANYLLVQNREIIHIGPMEWRPRYYQSELNDLGVNYIVPSVEPGYVWINSEYEFFPIASIDVPPTDMFEELAGPFWTYENGEAFGTFTKHDAPIDPCKGNLKNMVASKRYTKENTPFKMTVQGQEVTVDASRDNRNIFIQKYTMMGDTDTVQWKFPETWLELTKTELGGIVLSGAAHIQTQFDWEKSYVDRIEAAMDLDTLRTILLEIDPPPVAPGLGV